MRITKIGGIELEHKVFRRTGGFFPYRGQCDKCMVASSCNRIRRLSFTMLHNTPCHLRMIEKRPELIVSPTNYNENDSCPYCLTIYSSTSVQESKCQTCGAPRKKSISSGHT